ncbi:MAG: capsular polysaccharide biosynthesis protein [Pseudomonadota bacterium]
MTSRRVGAYSRGILRAERVRRILELSGWTLVNARTASSLDAIAGWAYRPSADHARRRAAADGLPYLALEDGFLRSLDLGLRGEPPLSLLLDPEGIHYAADTPSRLERFLNEPTWLTDDLRQRARDGIAFLRQHRLSKYNAAPPSRDDLPPPGYVLLIDQTYGDASLRHGGAVPETFQHMLTAARDENPGARLVIKTHPDVIAGLKRGHFAPDTVGDALLYGGDVSSWPLLERAERVYAVTSQLGFEAMMAGKPVRVFGRPFYAGWGATEDAQPIPCRTQRHSVETLFAAAYLRYPIYYDPFRDALTDFKTVATLLATQRRHNEANRRPVHCVGITLWKRRTAAAFLGSTATHPRFHATAEAAIAAANADRGRVAAWSARTADDLRAKAAARGVETLSVEDGFLRSIGLGQSLRLPASLAVDRRGIYYDPLGPSDLEGLIEAGGFAAEILTRAQALRQRIVREGVTKYVLPGAAQSLKHPPNRRLVLVIGQVEDDASIRRGTTDIASNRALLTAARAAEPDAFLVYKPHPDVEAGHRRGAIGDAAASADLIASETAAPALLAAADHVWTMTSLMGFEALLHGKTVTCAGWPFYAGWGETTDIGAAPEGLSARRTRRASTDEILAAAYLLYPRYVDPVTGMACEAEVILDRLAARDPAMWRHPSPLIRVAGHMRDRVARWQR